jgi:uncharacterized membrane protein YeaQ/YmgE (transglycosylase-associated protein family)
MEWLISLICGAVGGNLAGAVLKKLSLGTLWNSVVGILGGAGGMALLEKLKLFTDSPLINQVGGGAVGGGVLMAIVGFIKKAMGGAKA